MRRERIHVAEFVFVFLAASAIFVLTIQQMSSDGILPGNDPAVHLDKAQDIVAGTSYSDMSWYPPLFHTFVATLLLFVGTTDVMVASLVLKLVVSTISALILLSTYLFSRRFLGIGVAVASSVFTLLSVPLFKMISWGGYTTYLSIAYIVLIFYTMKMDSANEIKSSLLFLLSFTLVLTHHLSAFVFFLVFVPAFLIDRINAKKRALAFLAVILGGALAAFVWYAEIIFRYSDIFIYHIFFEMKENILDVPYVSFDSLVGIFGLTLFLGLAGIPLTLLLLKKRKALSIYLLLVLWIAVPFFLSQSFIFGLYLPYERFIYYLATPMAIFAGASVCSLAKLPNLMASKFASRIRSKRGILSVIQVLTFLILVSLLSSQGLVFLQRLPSYTQFFETSGMAGYGTGEWLKQYSVSDGQVVVSKKPGAWLHLISGHTTFEETWSPVLGRNLVAEAVLYRFYETESSDFLTREYVSSGSLSGQVLCLSMNNIWEKVVNIFDDNVYVTYIDNSGNKTTISLSETVKETHWIKKSTDESQLISKYSSNLFTVEKLVSIQRESLLININWKFTARQDLTGVEMRIFNLMEPFLDFKEALIPGVLYWQNPWDKPSKINATGNWAIVDCPPNSLTDDSAAILDAKNNILLVFEFADAPDWLNVGALGNRFIDALRIWYQFGDLAGNWSREKSFSIFPYLVEPTQIERPTQTALKQLLDSKVNLTLQQRDFLTYIKEYNIEFVVIDAELLPDMKSSPMFDKVYDNGKFIIYRIRQ